MLCFNVKIQMSDQINVTNDYIINYSEIWQNFLIIKVLYLFLAAVRSLFGDHAYSLISEHANAEDSDSATVNELHWFDGEYGGYDIVHVVFTTRYCHESVARATYKYKTCKNRRNSIIWRTQNRLTVSVERSVYLQVLKSRVDRFWCNIVPPRLFLRRPKDTRRRLMLSVRPDPSSRCRQLPTHIFLLLHRFCICTKVHPFSRR